jgi:hypothetical protein
MKTAMIDRPQRTSLAGLVCVGCGATASVSCNCGKAYVPPSMLAAAAIAANPSKSNRAIAEETGLGLGTVQRARKTGDPDGSPPKRTGKDGKSYPVKRKQPAPRPRRSADIEYSQDFGRRAAAFAQGQTEKFYAWLETNPSLPSEALRSLIGTMNVCSAQYSALAEAAADKMEEQS